jgi:hypothetical protein
MKQEVYVYLLWDNSRAEKLDPPELVDVFATRVGAERRVRDDHCDDLEEDWSEVYGIEQRELKS